MTSTSLHHFKQLRIVSIVVTSICFASIIGCKALFTWIFLSSFITVIIMMNSMIIDHGHHHHCHNHSPTLGHQDCLSDVDANPAKRKPNCRNSHIAKSTVHAAIEHPDVGYNVIQYRSYQHSAAKFANITISPHNISIVHPNLVFAKSTLYLIFFNVYEIHYKAQIIGFK